MQDGNTAVEELMTSEIVTATADTSVLDAVDMLRQNEINSLIIVDEADEMRGVITSTDFLTVLSEGDPDLETTVAQYLTEQVITISPDDSIQTAASRMITNDISHLPVEGEGEGIVGMISKTDITAHTMPRRASL